MRSLAHRSRTSQRRLRQLRTWAVFLLCMILIVLCVGAVLLSLGARLEHPDLTPAPASEAEQERQNLAVLAQRISSSTAALPADSALSTDAQEWVTDLGGVWVPWPQGAPEGYTNPQLDLTGFASSADVSAALWKFSQAAQSFSDADATATGVSSEQEATASDSSRGAAHIPLGLSLALSATKYAVAIDNERHASASCPTFSPDQLAALLTAHPAALEQLESARQSLELKQAGLNSDQRTSLTPAITTLAGVIDAALTAGTADVRPLLVQPPADSASSTHITDVAVTALAPLAANSEQVAAVVSLQCQLALDVTGSSRAADSSNQSKQAQ
ncbi:MAG: hypothetical protein PT944_03170 [Actinomycetaceae bacterium]|nr:hypothetical protein [Arcanobacterium sp.]MDD7686903.1 hypothetical protein [Actinomycetaceae bacterium]MDY5273445.1 hypothetical protein [Arcanobacterium sp.]